MATFKGNNSANKITGSTAADIIYAYGGNDIVNAGDGNDLVYGGLGADTLNGQGGNDALYGEDGNDRLDGGIGDDLLDGGTGIDTAVFSGSQTDYFITKNSDGSYEFQDLRAGLNNGIDTLYNIENIQFSIGTVALTSLQISLFSNKANTVNFNALPSENYDPNSIYDARDGDDNVILANSVQLSPNLQFDITRTFTAGNGNDVIQDGSSLAYKIDGGLGYDIASFQNSTAGLTINMGTGQVTKTGNIITQLSNIEEVIGSQFNDTISGNLTVSTGTSYTMRGGAGDDLFKVSRYGNGDTIDGGSGIDMVDFTTAAAAMNINMLQKIATSTSKTYAFNNIENVRGGLLSDTIIGDNNDNLIIDTGGTNTIDGGGGNDTFSFAGATNNAITVNLNLGTVTNGSSVSTVSNIEKFITSNANDLLIGNQGNHYFDGGAGDDLFRPGMGYDTIIGGAGTDTLSYNDLAQSYVVINIANQSSDKIGLTSSDYGIDNFSGIEKFIGTGANDTFIAAMNQNSVFDAGAGNDLIIDSTANDTYIGGDGNDSFRNLMGNNTIDGGLGQDSIDFRYPSFGDPAIYTRFELQLNKVTTFLAADQSVAGVTTFSGIETFYGSNGNDEFFGSNASETVYTGAGNDIYNAGISVDPITGVENFITGNDTVFLGDGDDYVQDNDGQDSYFGGNGLDTISFNFTQASGTGLLIDLVQGYATTLNSSLSGEFNIVGDFENVFGTSNNDVILGNMINNMLNGQSGDDTLNGGLGNDTLTGSLGNDTFVYDTKNAGADVITDFETGLDKIKFDASLNYDFSKLQIQQTDNGVLIQIDPLQNDSSSILLQGVNSVSSSDFVFA